MRVVRRREALAAATLAAVLLRDPAGARAAEGDADEAIVAAAIERHEDARAVYADLAAATRERTQQELMTALRRRARLHADELRELTGAERLGGDREAPARGAETGEAALRRALAVEERLLEAHLDAIGRLESPRLARGVADAAVAAGRHIVALRRALGREPLASAFESGSRP